MDNKLLSIDEAAKLLGVSRITFNKIRKEHGLSEVMVGKRARFYEDEVLRTLVSKKKSSDQISKTPLTSRSVFSRAEVVLNIFSHHTVKDIETKPNVFDLTLLKQVDPYAALSLLCTIVDRARTNKVFLEINDGVACQSLKAVSFFYHVESQCGSQVAWDRSILTGRTIEDTNLLMPIRAVTSKGAERPLAESLIVLLRKQGFNDALGRGIAQILGELADNAMTHSAQAMSERTCFISAQRFLYQERNCIIVGLADTGLGIPTTLKSNPKYSPLSDRAALLQAFRPYVTSWDSMRGKGLTDVLGIALGNNSYLRADSGPIGLLMDFHDRANPEITFNTPLTDVTGTRFGLILIDNHFEKGTREQVDTMLAAKEREVK